MRGTGRRGETIVDDVVDLLLNWKVSDSGIVFPSSGVQGWLARRQTNDKRGGVVPERRSLGVEKGLDGVVFMLVRGLDLGAGGSGATLGLYIKAPATTTMAPSEDSARSHRMAC
jgi:hypothetical protein